MPLMLALERLSPLERAAFLLHDVFGLEFDEVAETIQRDPAACRQLAAARAPMSARRDLVSRWKSNRVSRSRRPFSPPRAAGTWRGLRDAGGRRQRPRGRWRQASAATEPIVGFDAVMKVQEYLAGLFRKRFETCSCRIRQWITGTHYAGGRRRTPDDGVGNQGRKDYGHLCGAKSGQAAASALDLSPKIHREARAPRHLRCFRRPGSVIPTCPWGLAKLSRSHYVPTRTRGR